VTDFDPGMPTSAELADDHLFAAWAATVAGELLVKVRGEGLEGKELPFQVDAAADAVQCLIEQGLAETQQRFNS
jgi:3'(2'), 5'-bisphosphate nucleotidase